MTGSPPNLDMFDRKPELVKRDDQDCPDQFLEGREFAFTSGVPKLMGSPRKWKRVGENGMWMSDAIPHFHDIADEMCVVHSMYTDQFNHAPAELLVYTGSPRGGRPSMGSWVTYGLGSENEDLPGFVVLISSGYNPMAVRVRLAAVSCRRCFRECSVAAKVIPSYTHRIRRGWIETCGG